MSGSEAFRPVYDALSSTGFYNLNPEAIRDLQPPDPGDLLKRDGSNVASVLSNLSPAFKERVEEYLGQVVAGVTSVDRRLVGPKETLEFRQAVRGAQHPWRFFASNMSDGALRAFGILVALFQGAGGANRRLVGIEEPELTSIANSHDFQSFKCDPSGYFTALLSITNGRTYQRMFSSANSTRPANALDS